MILNNPNTELLFPLRAVSNLLDVRGREWRKLVEQVNREDALLIDQLAFILTVVKQAGCVSCNSDSFRAIRGCAQCSVQAIRRFKGSDAELLDLYQQSRIEVEKFLKKRSGTE
jgi:hypothetical protein